MEGKKKVKSITKADVSEKNKTVTDADARIKKIEEESEYYAAKEGSRKLRRIAIFLVAIIAIIWLLSLIGGSGGGNIGSGLDKASDATVYIENYNGSELTTSGSGFVYKKSKGNAYILTNYHVVSGSTSIRVIFSNDSKANATFVGGDQSADIAVISVPAAKAKRVAKIGSSRKLKVGSTVFAIGSPAGNNFKNTVTKGIISGKDRLVTVSNGGSSHNIRLIQTDADMDYGNAGGPLCNSKGQVVGIVSPNLVRNDLRGTSFAIPIEDTIRKVATMDKKQVTQLPYIGIRMVNLSDDSSLDYYGLASKLNTKLNRGVVVESIVANSPAEGKLKVADIITKINDEDVDNIAYLRYVLSKYKAGDKVTFTVERNGKFRTLSIILDAKGGN